MSSPEQEEHMTPVTAVADQPEPYEGQYAQQSIDTLTAGETAMAERTAAQSITTLGNEAYPQAGLLGALGWVMWRRREPRMKYDAYMSSRTLTEITKELGLGTTDEPTDDDDEEAGKDEPSSSSSTPS